MNLHEVCPIGMTPVPGVNPAVSNRLRCILASCKSYNFHVKARNRWRFRVFPPSCEILKEQLKAILEEHGRLKRGKSYWIEFSMPWFPIERNLGGLLPANAIEHYVRLYASEAHRIDTGYFRAKFVSLSARYENIRKENEDLRSTIADLKRSLEHSKSEAKMLWKLNDELNAMGLSRVIKRPHEPRFR
jgi:hypothetical protein